MTCQPSDRWVCSLDPDNPFCTEHDPCFACAEAAHAEAHPTWDVDGCPTCKLRSVQLSPAATPTKTRRFGKIGSKGNNSWEAGIVTDSRGMPILKPDGDLIRTKEYAEKRHSIEAGRRQVAQAPAPSSP